MGKTKLTVNGEKFMLNGKLTYSEIPTAKENAKGLLMNARFIQGIFDTSVSPERFNRYGKIFDAERNTDELVAALPAWYAKGLRAITVGMQGGGNCFTVDPDELFNNPFSLDGLSVDKSYLERLDKIINACDELGMVVIVSYFYGSNIQKMHGAQAIINAVKLMSRHLKHMKYSNIIIEIANEYNISAFSAFPILHEPQGMVSLINIAKSEAGDIPVGSSGGGGMVDEEVCQASDVVLIHGNGQSRGSLYNQINKTRKYAPGKPVVINEDSQALGNLGVCEELAVSWGYYNNMTKQEVPTYWEITTGEDEFFAYRMAEMIGIPQEEIPFEKQFYLQGLEPHTEFGGERFLRVASLYPEKINFVRFFKNDELCYVAYDESFSLNYTSNWRQDGIAAKDDDTFTAEVHLTSGEVIRL